MIENYKLLYSMISLAPGKHLPKSRLRAIIRIADEDGSLSGRFSKSRVKSAAQRDFSGVSLNGCLQCGDTFICNGAAGRSEATAGL